MINIFSLISKMKFFMNGSSHGRFYCLNRLGLTHSLSKNINTSCSYSFVSKFRDNVFSATAPKINSTVQTFHNFYMKLSTYMLTSQQENHIHTIDGTASFHNRASYVPWQEAKIKDDDISVIFNVFNSFLKKHNTNKQEIENVCEKLNSSTFDLNIASLIKLFYYLTVLKLGKESLLMKISKEISDKLDGVLHPKPLVGSYLRSMRKAMLRDIESLDKLLLWCSLREIDLKSIIELIHTLAVFNYFPLQGDILLKKHFQTVFSEFPNGTTYLEFVWSTVLLDRAEENMVFEVLTHDFLKKLEYATPYGIQLPHFIKIKNIFGYSQIRNFKVDFDFGYIDSETPWLNKLKYRKELNPDVKSIRDTVVHYLPLHTYSFTVFTDCGFFIDIVCYLNSESQPTTRDRFLKEENGIKLAIVVLTYHDYCSPGKEVTSGIIEFYRNFLEHKNYKVLFIDGRKFPKDKSLKDKFEFFKQNVQKVLPGFYED